MHLPPTALAPFNDRLRKMNSDNKSNNAIGEFKDKQLQTKSYRTAAGHPYSLRRDCWQTKRLRLVCKVHSKVTSIRSQLQTVSKASTERIDNAKEAKMINQDVDHTIWDYLLIRLQLSA